MAVATSHLATVAVVMVAVVVAMQFTKTNETPTMAVVVAIQITNTRLMKRKVAVEIGPKAMEIGKMETGTVEIGTVEIGTVEIGTAAASKGMIRASVGDRLGRQAKKFHC